LRPRSILLVSPPFDSRDVYDASFPLGLGYLGASLRARGHHVSYADLVGLGTDAAVSAVGEAIGRDSAEFVGVGAVTAAFDIARELLIRIKAEFPDVITVLGGVHVTMATDEVLSDGLPSNYAVLGEGERALIEIVESGSEGTPPGTIRREGNSYLFGTLRPLEEDIDAFPSPERMLRGQASVQRVITSRGCSHGCIFCASSAFWGRSVRYHSIERVRTEVQQVIESTACRNILIVDDHFIDSEERCLEIAAQLPRGPNYACLSRVDSIQPHVLKALRDVGFSSISLGCESGSSEALRRMGKGVSREDVVKAIRWCKEAGIAPRTSWVWGMPWDDESTLRKTVETIIETEPDEVILYRYIPYPGTPLTEHFHRGMVLPSRQLFSGSPRFIVPTDALGIAELEDHFATAIERLRKAGYAVNAAGEKTCATEFTRFKTFGTKEDGSNRIGEGS